jgi:hypothetical protein
LLPDDLSDGQLATAPVLDSIDALLIDELSVDENDVFAAALESSSMPASPLLSATSSSMKCRD